MQEPIQEFAPQQPASSRLAWVIILGFILLVVFSLFSGAASVLNLAYPCGVLIIALFLHYRSPLLYASFTWWVYFLTPLLRRLVDWKTSFTDPSPILLAPPLAALVCSLTLYRFLPKIEQQGGSPFLLSIAAVVYGFLVSVVQISPRTAIVSLFGWMPPILFGFYLYANWRKYPSYLQNLQRTFTWGVLVMGIYGIYQYTVAPEWDRLWLVNTQLFTSMGSPEPFKLRVWSTLNSILPFGVVMVGGLILLLSSPGVLRLPATLVGYVALLLSIVRTAWSGWAVAFMAYALSLQAKLQMRLFIGILLVLLCLSPLLAISPFGEAIQARLFSFFSLQRDISFNARVELYQQVFAVAIVRPFGYGLGSVPAGLDSGAMELLLSIGWFGTIPYMAGIGMILVNLYHAPESRSDGFINVARSVAVGYLPMLAGANIFIGVTGLVFWGFLGLGMAALKYHRQTENNGDEIMTPFTRR